MTSWHIHDEYDKADVLHVKVHDNGEFLTLTNVESSPPAVAVVSLNAAGVADLHNVLGIALQEME